jgi:DNA-binding transcriptional MocR family regulator
MSYKERLSDLRREGVTSLTQQIVDAFSDAIADGELGPGERLPATRALAELAGVNHLTAARAYRRLAELGLVSGRVGKGTFVRATAPHAAELVAEPEPATGGSDAWQTYALPDAEESYGDQVLAEMLRLGTTAEERLLPLSLGYPSPKLFPLDCMRQLSAEVLDTDGDRALQYGDVEGIPDLRAELAVLMERRGSAEAPENVIVTTGARQALTLAARAVLRPGDIAACESPSFIAPIESIRATGARTMPVPSDADGLDTEALEQLVRRHEIRLLALQPRLHNPTGRDLSPERRHHLVELARRHGFFVLEDGVYGDLRFEGESLPPLRADAPEHVIYVDSFSKSVGGGLRLGWVAASGPVTDRIVREKRNDDMHSASLTQLIGARFLAGGHYERHIEQAADFYRERCDALVAAVDRELEPIASVTRPLGGGHLWVTLDEPLDERVLYREAVSSYGVSFLPGGAMMPERPRRTHMRLSYGFLDPEQLAEGARRLAVAIRAMRRSGRPARAVPTIA